MNRHELVDVATIGLSGLLLGRSKFFSRSADSPPLGEVVEATTVPAVDAAGFDDGRPRSVEVETPVGSYEAAYLAWRWLGPERPTLVYHHGSGERPFDFGRFSSNSFRRLFAGGAFDAPVNLVAVRAPFHGGTSLEYARTVGELSDFVGMLATSTALVEGLRLRLEAGGSPAVFVSGISLGGYVTNLHRAYHDTADRYVPVFAGTALGEMFVSSVYQWMVGRPGRTSPSRLRDVLDFEDAFGTVASEDCAPLLARHDRIVEYDRQKPGYAGMDVAVIEKGHVTGSLATGLLRTHLEGSLVED